MQKLDDFTRAYIECALWSSTDENDEPLDNSRDYRDIADESLARIAVDCDNFRFKAAQWLTSEYCNVYGVVDNTVDSYAGHDFWLTRNGHGSGFWDIARWETTAGKALTELAHSFGECNLYVGDDGKVYV